MMDYIAHSDFVFAPDPNPRSGDAEWPLRSNVVLADGLPLPEIAVLGQVLC